ncbi:SusC/RagA family TonB-linked outer membrane protein [Christiangramia fulva]|uniref:SusC/RagA family TonB-linked outer membrane protein n=1 Tax=Christiangramia fulva TaxID=2126553 RepID=A0A2R3Z5T3_9FLAO|nr:SusC/RagA family TonB-linked outer membrane protein [Christiangramia fulva]AVR45608.1 SusC/RagA family TonB-linked outer membrane protein [Christiangramia fulva]
MIKITKLILSFSVFTFFMLASETALSQEDSLQVKKGILVSGVVKDAFTKEPLSGINISVPDFSATITKDDGTFEINVPSLNTPLLVKGEDYQIKEVPLRDQAEIEILLREEGYPSFYDEIHTPSGKKLESKITHATGTINSDDSQWGQSVNESVAGYMKGNLAGVYVTRRSGTPKMGAEVLIRGYNSLYSTNMPLIVVDGMIYDDGYYGAGLIENHTNSPLANIDIKDIQEITVIKDGSSLYGTKGANGVILITTSRPQDLTTKIDFAAYGGFNQAPEQLPLLGPEQYRTYLSELLISKGLTQEELMTQPFFTDNTESLDYYQNNNNTNWQERIFNDKSYNQNYYLKVQGGDNIAKYALSVGYLSSDGIVKNTGLQKYNTRFNADLKISPKLSIQANLSFVYSEQDLRNQGNSQTSPIRVALVKSPFLSQNEIDANGGVSPNLADSDIFNISNPAAIIDNAIGRNRNYRFFGDLNFGYEFNNSVKLNSIIGINYSKVRENFFIPDIGVVNDTLRTAVVNNRSGSEVQRLFTLYNDTYLDYTDSWGENSLDTRVGFRLQKNEAESDFGLGYNSATDDFTSVGAGTNALRRVGGFLGDWNWLNIYLSADYGFKNRYFLSLHMGLDGSSRFGEDAQDWAVGFGAEKLAFLPSVSGAWLISAEPFMKESAIDYLKLRASFGLSGNDDIGNYTAQKYYVSQNLLGLQGLVRGNIGNPELQWEVVRKADLGLDISLLNERLGASVDVYQNKTQNMIIYEPVEVSSGFDYVVSNSGSMKTEGFDLNIYGRILDGDFKWDSGLILSRYVNEVTSLPRDMIVTNFGGATYLTAEGFAPNLFYGLESKGVYTTNEEANADGLQTRLPNGELRPFQGGDIQFTDVNGDKIIDENDRMVIGDPNPDFMGSFSTKLSYGNFTLDALFNFSVGNDLYNGTRAMLESMSGYENQTLAVLNRWRANGQVTDIPKVSWGDPMGNSDFSSRWIERGDYLRLKTLILSYDLPVSGNTFRYAKVYATANNLFTVSDYLGYDPEFSATSSIYGKGVDFGLEPQFRTYQLGFRIGL